MFLLIAWLVATGVPDLDVSTSDLARWEAMDKAFSERFEPFKNNALGLKEHAMQLHFSAMEAGDCDLALVAQCLELRAQVMLGTSPPPSALYPRVPSGCDSDYPRLAYDMGGFMLQRGLTDEAESQFISAARMPKWASHAWNMVGKARMEAEDFDAAIDAWERAHAETVQYPNPSILINLGLVHARFDEWKRAYHWFLLAWEAHEWNKETNAYTFVEDIGVVITTNLLRAATNSRDEQAADRAWALCDPMQPTTFPLQQLRPMLDYTLWRGKPESVKSLVALYSSQIPSDSLAVVRALNDRALLFSPWRDSSHWELDRIIEVLALAEQQPKLRRNFLASSGDEAVVANVGFARDWWAWMARSTGALALLLSAGIAYWWFRIERKRLQLSRMSNAELCTELKASVDQQQPPWATPLLMNLVQERLRTTVLEGQIDATKLALLNERDIQVLEWILNGLNSHQIAEELGVTVQRVYNIRSELRTKLDLHPGKDWSDLKVLSP